MKPLLLPILLLCASFINSFAQEPLWLRYPAISPDGQTILFNYKGDIFQVAATGGRAIPLTISEHYDFSGKWSHDGNMIAFASDRYGNFDVFSMPAGGGEATRLTFHSNNEIPSDFSTDNENIIFSALRQDKPTNVQFPTGVMAELYSVPAGGGRVGQVLTTPAHDAVYSPDGSKLIFHDRKGYENDWRKHHTSAVTRDIWVYDLNSETYQQLSGFDGENRNPVFHSNGDDYYYLSEISGSFNVHKSSLSNPADSEQLTDFEDNPVRFLSVSNNNQLCFSYNGEIYKMREGESPQKIQVQIPYDGRQNITEVVKVNSGLTETSLSPNGKEFAYVFRGEVFVSSLEEGTTKRITNTPYQERSVDFSPDGRSLVFAAEYNNSWNLQQVSISREEELYFFSSTILKTDTLLATEAEEFQPAYSPDGKEVAYLENRTVLKVLNLATRQTRMILPGEHNYSYSDGDMWYRWSPDSKWFLVTYGLENRLFIPEVGLIEASGNGTLRNLTESGYADFGPKWALDGKAMIWGSTREGSRSESGWPDSGDVYAMFFTEKAYDRFQLSKEELGLLKEKEEKKEEEEEEPEDKQKKKGDDKETPEEDTELLGFDWNNLKERKERITVHTSQAADWLLSKDGEKLFYLTRFESQNNIWSTELRSGDTKLFARIGGNNVSFEMSEDGEFMLVLSDGTPMKVSTSDGDIKRISPKGEMLVDHASERNYIFDHAWRLVRQKFYVPDLHGVDWPAYYDNYKKFLPHISNNYDFAEMLSEMLGELNASHTGSGFRHNEPMGDATASLGVLYDYDHDGNGIMIAEILNKGPLDKSDITAEEGNIIEKIDGVLITPQMDFYQLLNRKANEQVLLSMLNPDNRNRWEEVVKPISLGAENQLLYDRWVRTRREDALRLSEGRIGYVHVRGMNDPSMRVVIEEALGKHLNADALIVDTRFNGGGNLHDALSEFLNGKKYFDIIPHGKYMGFEPMNRWIKPSIVVMGESNYSDAHLFPVAYKMKGVGQTLGMPVPGTGTFVWWETQIDPTLYFGIPMGGWRPVGEDGFLENNQLEPDIRVQNEPGAMADGKDQQLEEAVKVLMEE